MANRWKGNLVANAATSDGTNYTGKANGAWSLNSQLQQKQANLWAKGQNLPSAPTIGTATAGNAQASIVFTAPSDTGGLAITGYTAVSSPGGITATGASSPITITGLTNDTAYTFTIAAINLSGVGAYSAASNSVTPISVSVPFAPTVTSVTKVNATSANINFVAPSYDGNSTITSYTVTSSPSGITASVNQSGSGSIAITGLPADVTYTFTVTATNTVGTSQPSSPSSSIYIGLVIGEPLGGGFYAGKISTTANGVATHYLIVAPKATGENASRTWGSYGVTTAATSVIDGPANSVLLAGLGAAYQAAIFCEGLTIGGYSDWYLPANNELEVLYYFLKPTTSTNRTDLLSGSNANAVSPEPISTNYTSDSPAQTSAGIGFRIGETNAFALQTYWSSTEVNNYNACRQYFGHGLQSNVGKNLDYYVRAVRRIAV